MKEGAWFMSHPPRPSTPATSLMIDDDIDDGMLMMMMIGDLMIRPRFISHPLGGRMWAQFFARMRWW